MDMLEIEDTDTLNLSSRNLYYGPKTVPAPAYGISIDLPSGWIAAVEQGEIYGIQSLYNDSDRIYVMAQNVSSTDANLKMTSALEIAQLQLRPCSDLRVNGNHVSCYFKVDSNELYTDAFVLWAMVSDDKSIVFAALCDESALPVFRDTAKKVVKSIKLI